MTPPPPPRSGVTGTDSGNTNCMRVRVEGLLQGQDDVVSYSRSVCVCARGDVARGRGLQHLGGAHHDVKLTCVGGQTKKKKKKKSKSRLGFRSESKRRVPEAQLRSGSTR